MGELLRAVCDKTCIDSNPAFYTARLSFQIVGPTANVFADRSTIFETKRDTWFLLMGWAQSTTFEVAGVGATWQPIDRASGFTLRDVKTGRRFNASDTVPKFIQNYNLNNFVTLPEYVLWEPGSSIEVIQNVQIATANALTFDQNNVVTLAGIEYKLPERAGGYLSGKAKP